MKKIWNFVKEEDGLEMAEYAVMGALIVIALVAAVTTFRTSIAGALTRIAGVIDTAG